MGKKHPDDLIIAASKHLKADEAPVLRFTLKRGGLWKPQFSKAHSRIARRDVKNQVRAESGATNHEQVFPLLAKFRTNQKEEKVRINCETKVGKGGSLLQSLMGVFRVNFFKKKEAEKMKEKKEATKADPNSKTTLKKKQRSLRNKERRQKRTEISRRLRAEKRKLVK